MSLDMGMFAYHENYCNSYNLVPNIRLDGIVMDVMHMINSSTLKFLELGPLRCKKQCTMWTFSKCKNNEIVYV